jgi:hypothetical protein
MRCAVNSATKKPFPASSMGQIELPVRRDYKVQWLALIAMNKSRKAREKLCFLTK